MLEVLKISPKDFFDWEHLDYSDEAKREYIKDVVEELPPDILNLCFRIVNSWRN